MRSIQLTDVENTLTLSSVHVRTAHSTPLRYRATVTALRLDLSLGYFSSSFTGWCVVTRTVCVAAHRVQIATALATGAFVLAFTIFLVEKE